MCDCDDECIRKVELVFDALDRTWVWPLWPNRCHAWCEKFLEEYNYPAEDSLFNQYVQPLYIGWVPGWEDHGVIIFFVKGKKVYLDKSLQGGSDHIAFEARSDLIYPDDPRYAIELERRDEDELEETEEWPFYGGGAF